MRSKTLLAANILAAVYSMYLILYFSGVMADAFEGVDLAAGTIATALVTPHIILFSLGTIFGWIGFILKKSWAALAAAILYSAGTLCCLLYAVACAPIMILGFVGYDK